MSSYKERNTAKVRSEIIIGDMAANEISVTDKSIWHYRKVDVTAPTVIIKIGDGRKKMKME